MFYSKFIVWIFFPFPEGTGVLELFHFIGSVIAGGEQSSVSESLLIRKRVCKFSLTHFKICSGTPLSLNCCGTVRTGFTVKHWISEVQLRTNIILNPHLTRQSE